MKTKNLFLMAVAIMLAACGGKKQEGTTELPDYDVMTLKSETRTVKYTYPAVLKGDVEVSVYPQVSGRIIKKYVTGGGFIKKGQPIVTIDPTTAELQVSQAESAVKTARVALNNAKMEYDSQKSLFDKNIVSALVLQRAENAYQTAQANVAQAEASLSIAKTNLGYYTVVAPQTGIVDDLATDIGILASPSMPKPLVTISDQSKITATFAINEEMYLSLFQNQEYEMTEEGPRVTDGKKYNDRYNNITLQLKDGSIYPEKGWFTDLKGMIDRSTGSVAVDVHFNNPNNLLHSGNTATIIFPTEVKDAIVVPQTACKKLQDKYLIFKVNANGCAEGVIVDVMPTDDNKEYIVLSGLKAGDKVLANGVNRIQDGQVIEQKAK